MKDINVYDTLIMVTPKDYLRLQRNYHRLIEKLPSENVLFIGSAGVSDLISRSGLGEGAGFVNENDIIPFQAVHKVVKDVLKDILNGQELPQGITGWYYQQFLKMKYAEICRNDYYLVWDGDTIPCREFSMFRRIDNKPYFDLKKEYHREYFETMSKLLPGFGKCVEGSFISEHMLMRCDIMQKLIDEIQSNDSVRGKTFWEKILYAVGEAGIQSNSFSEFETYGTYVALNYPNEYQFREWHSFRYGGDFFEPDTISDEDYEWLGKSFDAITFEKGAFVREDHKNLFDNKKYQEKLSARRMLEIAQEEFGEGSYQEVWDEPL